MMDCRNFEITLWESPLRHRQAADLSPAMKEHLQQCLKCREIYADFLKLLALADDGRLHQNPAYWRRFEKAVWAKINWAKSAEALPANVPPVLNRQIKGPAQIRNLAISFGLSIAAVAFFFLSLPDLTDKLAPPPVTERVAEAGKSASEVPIATVPARNIILKKQPMELVGADETPAQDFSILPSPQVQVVSDSALVTIDAVYLTDQGLESQEAQIRRASSRDIIEGSARAQMKTEALQPQQLQMAPADRVITFEKMPRMKKAVPPDYPPLAYKLKKGGEVWIKAKVDSTGLVTEAQIYSGSGTSYGFEEAALRAASLNEFEPFEVDNQKLPIWVIYKVRFVINE